MGLDDAVGMPQPLLIHSNTFHLTLKFYAIRIYNNLAISTVSEWL